MTDELMPTPTPASSAIGSVSAGPAAQPPIGVTTTAATSIASAEPVDAAQARQPRDAVGEHDVEREAAAALANAIATPSGSPSRRTPVSR